MYILLSAGCWSWSTPSSGTSNLTDTSWRFFWRSSLENVLFQAKISILHSLGKGSFNSPRQKSGLVHKVGVVYQSQPKLEMRPDFCLFWDPFGAFLVLTWVYLVSDFCRGEFQTIKPKNWHLKPFKLHFGSRAINIDFKPSKPPPCLMQLIMNLPIIFNLKQNIYFYPYSISL